MQNFFSGILAATIFIGYVVPAQAQESDWEYTASAYLFAPETSTSMGTPIGVADVSLSFSETLENLDFAFMGAIEARKDKWGFIGDYMFTDVEFQRDFSGRAVSQATTTVETQIFAGYAIYRVHSDQKTKVDLGGGYRWFKTEPDFGLTGNAGATVNFGSEASWVNPLLAARVSVDFSDRWSGILFADYGGFSGDSESWQALVTADYAINDNWLLRAGYRHLRVDHEINGLPYSFEQSGPVLGLSYKF